MPPHPKTPPSAIHDPTEAGRGLASQTPRRSRRSGTLPRVNAPIPADRDGGGHAPGDRFADPLEAARASLRALVDLVPDFVVLHRDGRVVHANAAVARALGFESGDCLLGSSLLDLVELDDRAGEAARLLRPSGGPAERPTPLRWRRRIGGTRATEAVATVVDFEGSQAVVVVAQDVTERAEFQHQLLQRDRMAALGTLSAGVAHEINNPLTYLLVNLEFVLRRLRALSASDDPIGELTAEAGAAGSALTGLVQSLQQAVDGANRVRQIVRDLLTFSQGNVEQRGAVDVRGILESAIQMGWHELRHRARLVKNLAEVPPVDANEARLGQVFLNLLVNAAQAVPEGHADENEIRVVTRTDERGSAVVEVSDSGVGIAPEDMPRIFDPFFTTKGEGGTGLGLAISHGTVKDMGGEIQVESAPGQGTTFRVVLPPSKTRRGSPTPSGTAEARADRPRVLVVDDEKLVGEAIARSLGDDNDVEIVTDAHRALERIGDGETYDLILCDLMMPVMTGMDLYAEVVRAAPKLAGRIVFMTGGAFTSRARAFLESVVNACLEKPLDIGKLRSLIARAGRD
ncbi:MAG: response regulator [Myxococcales bacterium]|nr:response regulator [Myxococcales bacterium]